MHALECSRGTTGQLNGKNSPIHSLGILKPAENVVTRTLVVEIPITTWTETGCTVTTATTVTQECYLTHHDTKMLVTQIIFINVGGFSGPCPVIYLSVVHCGTRHKHHCNRTGPLLPRPSGTTQCPPTSHHSPGVELLTSSLGLPILRHPILTRPGHIQPLARDPGSETCDKFHTTKPEQGYGPLQPTVTRARPSPQCRTETNLNLGAAWRPPHGAVLCTLWKAWFGLGLHPPGASGVTWHRVLTHWALKMEIMALTQQSTSKDQTIK